MKRLRLLDYSVVIYDYDRFYNYHKLKSQYLVYPCMLPSGNISKRIITYSRNKDQELLENGYICYNYASEKIFIKPKSIKKIIVNVICMHYYGINIDECDYNNYKNAKINSKFYFKIIDENDVEYRLNYYFNDHLDTCQFLQKNFNLGKIKKIKDMFETIFRHNYNHEHAHTFTYSFDLRN